MFKLHSLSEWRLGTCGAPTANTRHLPWSFPQCETHTQQHAVGQHEAHRCVIQIFPWPCAASDPGTLPSAVSAPSDLSVPISKYDVQLMVIVSLSSWPEYQLQLKPAPTSEGDRLSSRKS